MPPFNYGQMSQLAVQGGGLRGQRARAPFTMAAGLLPNMAALNKQQAQEAYQGAQLESLERTNRQAAQTELIDSQMLEAEQQNLNEDGSVNMSGAVSWLYDHDYGQAAKTYADRRTAFNLRQLEIKGIKSKATREWWQNDWAPRLDQLTSETSTPAEWATARVAMERDIADMKERGGEDLTGLIPTFDPEVETWSQFQEKLGNLSKWGLGLTERMERDARALTLGALTESLNIDPESWAKLSLSDQKALTELTEHQMINTFLSSEMDQTTLDAAWADWDETVPPEVTRWARAGGLDRFEGKASWDAKMARYDSRVSAMMNAARSPMARYLEHHGMTVAQPGTMASVMQALMYEDATGQTGLSEKRAQMYDDANLRRGLTPDAIMKIHREVYANVGRFAKSLDDVGILQYVKEKETYERQLDSWVKAAMRVAKIPDPQQTHDLLYFLGEQLSSNYMWSEDGTFDGREFTSGSLVPDNLRTSQAFLTSPEFAKVAQLWTPDADGVGFGIGDLERLLGQRGPIQQSVLEAAKRRFPELRNLSIESIPRFQGLLTTDFKDFLPVNPLVEDVMDASGKVQRDESGEVMQRAKEGEEEKFDKGRKRLQEMYPPLSEFMSGSFGAFSSDPSDGLGLERYYNF